MRSWPAWQVASRPEGGGRGGRGMPRPVRTPLLARFVSASRAQRVPASGCWHVSAPPDAPHPEPQKSQKGHAFLPSIFRTRPVADLRLMRCSWPATGDERRALFPRMLFIARNGEARVVIERGKPFQDGTRRSLVTVIRFSQGRTGRRSPRRGEGRGGWSLPVSGQGITRFSRSRPCARCACSARAARLRRP